MELTKNTAVVFTEEPHSYHRVSDGKELIGVTSMMAKHGLSANYTGIAPEILAKAAAKGKAIHKQLEDYDDCLPVVVDANLIAYKGLGLDVVCSEYLVSDNETVASCIDKVLADGSLVDVKTTSEVHVDAVSWQLSIYAYLFEKQNPGLKVPHLYCAHVRDGKAKLVGIQRKSDAEVEELIRCEREGEIFICSPFDDTEDDFIGGAEVMELGEVVERIAALEITLKALKEKQEGILSGVEKKMDAMGVSELPCSLGRFVKGKDFERTTIDSAALKKALPEVAAKYSKTSVVRGKVTFKPNK